MVTAAAFADQCMIPYNDGWGYIYGTWGSIWTEKKQKAATRPQTVKYGARWVGKMVTDCSGLPRWALWQLGDKTLLHHAYYQYTDCCKTKGLLIDGARADGQPIKRGTAVFLKGSGEKIHHVGVYVGNGIVVEAKGTQDGVVISTLSHWDHWGEYKAVDYSAEKGDKPIMRRMLKKGMEGEDVLDLQKRLIELGYDLGSKGADGKFGTKTDAAVKAFQTANGLKADGIAGPDTLKKLGLWKDETEQPETPEIPNDPEIPDEDKPLEDPTAWDELRTAYRSLESAMNSIKLVFEREGIEL